MQTGRLLLGTGRRLTGPVWVYWRVLKDGRVLEEAALLTTQDGKDGTAAQQRRATTINALPRRNLKE